VTDSATFTTPENEDEDLGDLLLEVLPGDGSTMGNLSAREALSRAAERQVSEEEYAEVKDRLVGLGLILKGQGRGGSVRLAEGIEGGSRYEAPSAPAAGTAGWSGTTAGEHLSLPGSGDLIEQGTIRPSKIEVGCNDL